MAEKIITQLRMLSDKPLTAAGAAAMIATFADFAAFTQHAKLGLHFGNNSAELRFPRTADWSATIASHFDRLSRLVCDDYHQDPAPRLAIDLRTKLMTIDLPVLDTEAATRTDDLAKALGLRLVDHDLYRYRKSAVTYESAGWDTARFAAAMKATIANITGGAKPVIQEAYYTYEHKHQKNVERLRGFFDADELIDSLTTFAETDSKAANLREIGLAFEGPAEVTEEGPTGRTLGIHVRALPAPVRVTFLSSLAPETVAAATAPIRKAVELGDKPVAAQVGGSSASNVEVKTEQKFWAKFWTNSLAVPALTALATLLVSTQVLQAVLTDHEIVLTAPVEKGAEYVMSKPGSLELQWYARTTDTLWRRRDFDVPARVEVVADGQVVGRAEGRSKATVTLAAGNYVIVLRPDEEIDPVRFTVKVGGPEASQTTSP